MCDTCGCQEEKKEEKTCEEKPAEKPCEEEKKSCCE